MMNFTLLKIILASIIIILSSMIGEISMISINLDKGNKHNLLESSHKYSSSKNNFLVNS